MKKANKLCVLMLVGVLTCTTPMPVFAESNFIQTILDKGLSSLASDPDKITDMVLYVKGLIDSDGANDDQLLSLLHQAEQKFGVELSDSEESTLLNMVKELKNVEIDENTLRTEISSAYNKLKDMGIDKEEAKGIFEIALEFVKNVF